MSLMAMSAGESVELRAARPPALSDPAKTPARISLSLGGGGWGRRRKQKNGWSKANIRGVA